jgi:hypothetical protein
MELACSVLDSRFWFDPWFDRRCITTTNQSLTSQQPEAADERENRSAAKIHYQLTRHNTT